ncbi:glycosyltransferase [uncultured Brachybacterium sp.]|uniref:glycosyltransferase n=1 Tax=uncultured Brachybacterium sp. TaxID=189680 RepID=UPI002630D342|nr:glycosyltransferase [uncultured Brachybacterium sp.]
MSAHLECGSQSCISIAWAGLSLERSPESGVYSVQPKVAIVCGYFDWFSGYQEVALARALAEFAEVTAFASDIVNPIFSDSHLEHIGVGRRYGELDTERYGVRVRRFRGRELRSMVVAKGVARELRRGRFDLVVQVMPGFLLPAVASTVSLGCPRVVLYGDNSAMYANLSPTLARAKFGVFAATKGLLYRFVNSRAEALYGYTPETIDRLKSFSLNKKMDVMPLVYDAEVFYTSTDERTEMRRELGLSDQDKLVIGIGKINRQKRFDLLVSAFEELAQEDSTIYLGILGLSNSGASAELRERVAKSSFRDRITLLPFGDPRSLRRLFNAADVGVWPRMPAVTIQQGMGTGLPVVLPHNPIVSHLVTDYRSGVYFSETGDEFEEMKKKIATQLSDTRTSRNDRVGSSQWLSARQVAEKLLNSHVE